MNIYGYFDGAAQTKPVLDPGLTVPCPVCLRELQEAPRITTSLMAIGDDRSYFFRAHKHCWDAASEAEQCRIESALIDSLPPASA